ncbi:MAG: response regulator transcription factor [Actinomycetota bacterium]
MSRKLRVLVVEDETELAAVVASYFEREGYLVETAFDGPTAVEKARSGAPDLIVLDLMLPGFDGIEVCRQVRTFSDAYILMLTARDEEVDKIVGFAVGADDYLVKPFSPRELIARTTAILRRPRGQGTGTALDSGPRPLKFGALIIDSAARVVTVGDSAVDLTRTEFDLLECMAENPKSVFSREKLLELVWGGDWYGDIHVVDVHIGHLRKKLTGAGMAEEVIRTVRGYGYGMAGQ